MNYSNSLPEAKSAYVEKESRFILPHKLENVDEQVATLAQAVRELTEKLSPLLAPSQPSGLLASIQNTKEFKCPVEERLDRILDGLIQSRGELSNLINNLPL